MKQDNQKAVAFYVAADNQDLLNRIHALMEEKGMIGLKDGFGRYHYVIDGRKGAPFAVRRMDDMARIMLRDARGKENTDEINAEFYVDAVLSCFPFDRSLRGFEYLRYMLIETTLHPSLKSRLSKVLYPAAARIFQVRPAHIERNLRYCLDKLKAREEAEAINEPLPVVFREGEAVYQAARSRVLKKGAPRYSNSLALSLLSGEVREMIQKDRRRKGIGLLPGAIDVY